MEHFEVRLFASFAELFGAPQLKLILPRGSTVAELASAIQSLPAGASLPDKLVVAVNQSYVKADTVLAPGDEIALIPPVAGG
jgi:molybdopterin converting factor subunit 1